MVVGARHATHCLMKVLHPPPPPPTYTHIHACAHARTHTHTHTPHTHARTHAHAHRTILRSIGIKYSQGTGTKCPHFRGVLYSQVLCSVRACMSSTLFSMFFLLNCSTTCQNARGGSRISETGVRAQNPIHPQKNLNFLHE